MDLRTRWSDDVGFSKRLDLCREAKADAEGGIALLCVPIVGYAITMLLLPVMKSMGTVELGSVEMISGAWRLIVALVWYFAYFVMLLCGIYLLAPVASVLLIASFLVRDR